MSKHNSYIRSFSIPVGIVLLALAHKLNGYEICLNTTYHPIVNVHDFRY